MNKYSVTVAKGGTTVARLADQPDNAVSITKDKSGQWRMIAVVNAMNQAEARARATKILAAAAQNVYLHIVSEGQVEA